MAAAGATVEITDPARFKKSIPPLRTWVSRSVSEPSWLAGKKRISSRPPEPSRSRCVACSRRALIGWVSDCPVASL